MLVTENQSVPRQAALLTEQSRSVLIAIVLDCPVDVQTQLRELALELVLPATQPLLRELVLQFVLLEEQQNHEQETEHVLDFAPSQQLEIQIRQVFCELLAAAFQSLQSPWLVQRLDSLWSLLGSPSHAEESTSNCQV